MPATLKSLTATRVSLDVALGDDPAAITVTYIPNVYNARIEAEIASASNGAMRPAKALVEMVLAMVVAWNLRPDEDEPIIPLTATDLAMVPSGILGAICQAIGADQSPKATITRP